MPANLPVTIPMISYEDSPAAIDWLSKVFGFQEHHRITDDDGVVSHAELRLGQAVVFVATPSKEYQSPKHHAETCETARTWQRSPWIIDGVLIFVDDLDKHYYKAQAAGALILTRLEDGYPGRRYRAQDCEGHRWMFMQTPNAVLDYAGTGSLERSLINPVTQTVQIVLLTAAIFALVVLICIGAARL